MNESVAYKAGFERGSDAGAWVTDGNTTVETARAILVGVEDGDPVVMDKMPSPLSGEWAGESIPELSAQYGIDFDENEGIADEYEFGFSDGYWRTVQIDCRRIVGVEEGER